MYTCEEESMSEREELKLGTYVLATKWNDGDPCDHFCVGTFRGTTTANRYLVEDGEGKLFRANGFRRCEKINKQHNYSVLYFQNRV